MKHSLLTGLVAATLSAQAIADHPAVEQRQELFERIEQGTERLEDLADDRRWDEVSILAEDLAAKATELTTLFPQQSRDQGRSRDAIWEEWPRFLTGLERLSSDYRAVGQHAVGGDERAALEALDRADSSCRGCHMDYRSLW